MNRTLAARLDRLDQARADREPVPPVAVGIENLDGTVTVGGLVYDSQAEARAAHHGEMIVARVVDASHPQEVDHAA